MEELERVLTGDLTSVSRVFVLLRVSTRVGELTELRCLSVSVLTSGRELGVALLRSPCRVLTSVEREVGVRTDVRCCTEELDLTAAGDDLVRLDKTLLIRVLDFRTSTELRVLPVFTTEYILLVSSWEDVHLLKRPRSQVLRVPLGTRTTFTQRTCSRGRLT